MLRILDALATLSDGQSLLARTPCRLQSSMRPEPLRIALAGVRGLIDGVDDALLALLAGRRRLVAIAAGFKQAAGWPAPPPCWP